MISNQLGFVDLKKLLVTNSEQVLFTYFLKRVRKLEIKGEKSKN